MAATAMSRPVPAARTCSTRTRKMISSDRAMAPNRFAVPVHAMILRRIGSLNTNLRPSAISALRFWRWPPGGGASRPPMASSDATETASARSTTA